MIISLQDKDDTYTVGQDGITKIEPSKNGTTKKTTMYKLTYEDDSIMFLGLLDHEVVYGHTQTDIFDFLGA